MPQPSQFTVETTEPAMAVARAAAPARRMANARARPQILTLFSVGFAREAWQHRATTRQIEAHFEGFDLFSFPSNVRLLSFNLMRFVERLQQRYRRRPISGVVSANEQFGALAAALLARRLNLPHTDPRAILICQHKAYCRMRLQQLAPEANITWQAFPYDAPRSWPSDLPLPFFVKPVKATFSVLARRINTPAELEAHLDFAPYERFVIRRLVRPFNQAFEALIGRANGVSIDAHWLIAEEILRGRQLNLDGYVFNGELHALGCVEEKMYPGTDAFLRFEYPARLPDGLRERAVDLARRVLRGIGFDHGFFNIELMYDAAADSLKIVEINPRLASQLADLYERVDGLRVFDMLLELAQGRDPARLARARPSAGAAASFVWRCFDGAVPPPAADAQALAWLKRTYPDALLHQHHKRGYGLRREYKWLGSHRYATLNIGAPDEAALQRRYQEISARFGWPAAA